MWFLPAACLGWSCLIRERPHTSAYAAPARWLQCASRALPAGLWLPSISNPPSSNPPSIRLGGSSRALASNLAWLLARTLIHRLHYNEEPGQASRQVMSSHRAFSRRHGKQHVRSGAGMKRLGTPGRYVCGTCGTEWRGHEGAAGVVGGGKAKRARQPYQATQPDYSSNGDRSNGHVGLNS